MVVSTLLVIAQYASSAILGSAFISDITVVEGVCVAGEKVISIR